jgi:hypothetical protein
MKTMRHTIALWLLVAIPAAACSKDQQARLAQLADSIGRSASSGSAQSSTDGSSGNDPCTLVSRAEAEQLMGPLRHDPFRVNSGGNRIPEPNGTACFYENRVGRRVIMEVDWKDGKMAMGVVAMGGRLVEQAIPTDTGQADTLEGRWDELRMLPGDNLFARKGDQMVSIDYLGSGIGLAGAAKWAHIALGRLGHPLAYDGAAAGRTAPGPLVTPGDPCALVDRAEAEQIIGRLAGDPVTGPHRDICTYTFAQSRGLAGKKLELIVSWSGGWQALENSRTTMNVVVSKVAPPMAHGSTGGGLSQGSAPGAPHDSGFGKFMNGIMNVARSVGGVGVQADSSGHLQSDTLVAGPWDAGELQNGTALVVVRHDVMLSLGFSGITYEQAKALLAKAVARL